MNQKQVKVFIRAHCEKWIKLKYSFRGPFNKLKFNQYLINYIYAYIYNNKY